jgi:hypothetical protein
MFSSVALPRLALMTVAFHSRGTVVKTEDNEEKQGSSKRILNLGFHFCFCVSYPFYPRLPRRSLGEGG